MHVGISKLIVYRSSTGESISHPSGFAVNQAGGAVVVLDMWLPDERASADKIRGSQFAPKILAARQGKKKA
jgi:hypothetical protein